MRRPYAMRALGANATPEEVDAYKRFVMTVAQTVASADKEGGFLGIGGKQISDAENQGSTRSPASLGLRPTAPSARPRASPRGP